MPVELIGMIGTQGESRSADSTVHVSTASGVSPEYIAEFAQVHEASGFDRVLIGYRATTADGFAVASYAAHHTTKLGFLIAHGPGFVQPTVTARLAATLDQLTVGRIALHLITGGSDADQRRDGDFENHDTRYRRTGEYMDVLRRVWTSEEPFDYEGEFYRFAGAYSQVKPLQQPHVPLYFGGASGPAVTVGAQYADVYALWGEPLAGVRERIEAIRPGECAVRAHASDSRLVPPDPGRHGGGRVGASTCDPRPGWRSRRGATAKPRHRRERGLAPAARLRGER